MTLHCDSSSSPNNKTPFQKVFINADQWEKNKGIIRIKKVSKSRPKKRTIQDSSEEEEEKMKPPRKRVYTSPLISSDSEEEDGGKSESTNEGTSNEQVQDWTESGT